MVHVKKVEIFGFKSFGFRNTTIQFEPGLVSISGPNGSGKSNVLDAIIFATGETRPRQMRVSKISKLVHDMDGSLTKKDGSSPRRGRGVRMTRVAVYFDNKDRKIPVASDTVSVARELDENGENSTYYLNNKKDSLAHIINLLDMARAGPSQFNVVQQGTVTSISDFTPIEKRKSIEEKVGISSFDEKARQAQETLDYADRKLEVALATMGQVKERIDELEEERNLKMRHDLLRAEIGRYRAIDAISQLRELDSERVLLESEHESAASTIADLKTSRDTAQSEYARLDGERTLKMDAENDYLHAKAELESQIRSLVTQKDEADSMVSVRGRRLSEIDKRLDEIRQERIKITESKNFTNNDMREAEKTLGDAESARDALESKLRNIDDDIKGIVSRQSEASSRRTSIENAITALNEEKMRLDDKTAQAQRRHDNAIEKANEYSCKHDTTRQDVGQLQKLMRDLDSAIRASRAKASEIASKRDALGARRTRMLAAVKDIEPLFEMANKAAAKYESKIKTVKGFMHEDYTSARLKEDAARLGIEGLVYELMSWDPAYERPIMAASSDWIKSIVVKDFDALFELSKATRSQGLTKFKIIPLDVVGGLEQSVGHSNPFDSTAAAATAATITDSGAKIVGNLAEHVTCAPKYDSLKTFLFGNVTLVEDLDSATTLSRSGYAAVTLSGEYFEAWGRSVVVDMGSKISNITRLISMSGDVDGLLRSISLVGRYIQKKRRAVDTMAESLRLYDNRIAESNANLQSALVSHSLLKNRLDSSTDILGRLPQKIEAERTLADNTREEIASYKSQIASTLQDISSKRSEHALIDPTQYDRQLDDARTLKAKLDADVTRANAGYSRISLDYNRLKQTLVRLASQDEQFEKESRSLNEERPVCVKIIQENDTLGKDASRQLDALRKREQELISTSGSSMDEIRRYDARLKELGKNERELSREIGRLERRSDQIDHTLSAMSEREQGLRQTAAGYKAWDDSGRKNTGAHFAPATGQAVSSGDYVRPLIRELESELESLVDLNAGATSKYLEVTRGYKTQSERKNSLESERNSIVRFIKKIEREKRQTFLDAFETVDNEIRTLFKKMTGGSAWLELQDEDAIFDSGITYMVQFPDKPRRDSTSISGGEKTLAAVVFVLALQKLQPSPFYLFDEVDAHLDAKNAERLSTILAERARESQFIVVSLKESVVEKAGLVYGVFPKGGVSNVVMYKDRRLLPPVT